jgi:hypothetical protein
MWKLLGTIVLLTSIVGCGNKAAEMRGSDPVEWAELRALDETLRGIGMAASMEQWKASQAEVKPDVIKPALDAFAASSAPAGYNAASKDAVVTAYKELIDAAQGDTNAYAKKYEALMTALRELRTVPQ